MVRDLSNLTLRAAGRVDADQICDVHVASWRAGYAGIFPADWLDSDEFEEGRRERWRRWRLGPGDRVAVAVDDTVCAFAWYGPERDRGRNPAGRGEITAFYAHPRVWGTGTADALMEHTELRLRAEGFPEAVLWVLTDNPRARRFYERHGWSATGITADFVAAGVTVPEVEYRKSL